MEVKSHTDVASLPLGCLLQNTNEQKRQEITSVGEDVEKLELPWDVGGNVKYYEKRYGSF